MWSPRKKKVLYKKKASFEQSLHFTWKKDVSKDNTFIRNEKTLKCKERHVIDAIEEMGPNKAFQVITKNIHVCKKVRKIVREEMFLHITYSSCELHMFTWLVLKDDINSLHCVSMLVQNVGTMV